MKKTLKIVLIIVGISAALTAIDMVNEAFSNPKSPEEQYLEARAAMEAEQREREAEFKARSDEWLATFHSADDETTESYEDNETAGSYDYDETDNSYDYDETDNSYDYDEAVDSYDYDEAVDSYDYDDGSTPTSLEGTKWVFVKAIIDDIEMDDDEYFLYGQANYTELSIEFKDSNLAQINRGSTSLMIYRYSDGHLTIEDHDGTLLLATVDGNLMTFSVGSDCEIFMRQ